MLPSLRVTITSTQRTPSASDIIDRALLSLDIKLMSGTPSPDGVPKAFESSPRHPRGLAPYCQEESRRVRSP